jgi:hypothetical protein
MQIDFARRAVATLVAFAASALMPALAWAGGAAPVPGPIAGAGLPALVIAGAALWLVRKYRRRSQRD